MKRLAKTSFVILLLLVLMTTAFGAGLVLGGSSVPARAAEASSDFTTLRQVWDIVYDHFVDREVIESTNLEYAAINGIIDALGDEGHTRFMTPEELIRQRTDISGRFFGIGAMVGERDGMPVIVAPFEGSPAEAAGVKAGDIITEVDGQDVSSWTLSEVVDHVRGEEGTVVVLTLLRPSDGETIEISITRGEITVPAVSWTMLPGTQVAMIRLSRFSANALEEITDAIRDAEDGGATSLILDLRNNPGGLLDQAIRVTSQFLREGNVLQQEDAEGNRTSFPVRSGGLATEIPVAVLVNQGSASSAEIFAGALQDHRRGPVIGETTFGTGTVLEPFDLDDGSGLLLGTSQWLTANGRLIRKIGIEPDYAVELRDGIVLLHPSAVGEMTVKELLESGDAQLLKALELLDALPINDTESQPVAAPMPHIDRPRPD